jgi:hypothetical protein
MSTINAEHNDLEYDEKALAHRIFCIEWSGQPEGSGFCVDLYYTAKRLGGFNTEGPKPTPNLRHNLELDR